eukprot:855372-Amphidinium_carterae.1
MPLLWALVVPQHRQTCTPRKAAKLASEGYFIHFMSMERFPRGNSLAGVGERFDSVSNTWE